MRTSKLILTGVLAVALGLSSTGVTKAEGEVGGNTPGVAEKQTAKVTLKVRVYDGERLLFTFTPYKNVDAGTVVSLDYLKENVKIDGYDIEWLGYPKVLDKDYTMEVKAKAKGTDGQKPGDANKPGETQKPGGKTENPTNPGGKEDPKKDPKKDTPKSKQGNKKLPKTSAVK
jgi:hypothetical protein